MVSLATDQFSLRVIHPLPSITHSTKESLERIAYEFCEDCARQNVQYAEYRFSPYLDTGVGCLGADYCDGIFAGLERGRNDFKVKVGCILVFMRNKPGE